MSDKMPRAFVIYLVALAVIPQIAVAVLATAGLDYAVAVCDVLTFVVVFGTFFWVAVWDSRSRWPELSARERAVRVLSFRS